MLAPLKACVFSRGKLLCLMLSPQTRQSSSSRVWLEIDLSVSRHNFGVIRDRVAPAGVVAVLKADAYGLGMKPIAAALAEAGAVGFGVAELNEALALSELKLPVQILGGLLPSEIALAIANDIIVPITDYESAALISAEAVRQNRLASCHFLIDTGMGRLGIPIAEAEPVVRRCVGLPNLSCRGIYSHFPAAYLPHCQITRRQIEVFTALLDHLADANITFEQIHIANSDAINNFPKTFQAPFTQVRTGINLHGAFDSIGRRELDLRPVLSLKTSLVSKRLLTAGSTIGYGCTHRLAKDTLIGTIAAGYADGLPLALSNRGYVLINGNLCPVLGRVSMDYTTVSLEAAPEAVPGDEVVCLGGDGTAAVSVEDWAAIKGTNPYDIICSFGRRVERRHV